MIMKRAAPLILGVLLMFHSPEGGPLWIACQTIKAVRPIGAYKQHVATRTRALIYTQGATFAVKEAPEVAVDHIEKCQNEEGD